MVRDEPPVLEWKEHSRAPDSEARDQGTSHFHSLTSISATGGSLHFSAPWIPSPKLGCIIYLWAEGHLRRLLICCSPNCLSIVSESGLGVN